MPVAESGAESSSRAQPSVAIGFVPRERFSMAVRSLESIFEHTTVDFELIVVDNCTPPRYWAEIEAVLAGHENVRILRTSELLLPGPCKELVAEVSEQELTCLVENDVIVTEGWLVKMIEALEERSAGVVTPLVLEDSLAHVHSDKNFGFFKFSEAEGGTVLDIVPVAATGEELASLPAPIEVEVAETHCLLFRTETLRRLKPFEEPLNTREYIDTSLILKKAGIPFVFQPASRVVFMTPRPAESEERSFFLQKWDLEHAAWSHERLMQKWGLSSIPGSLPFIADRIAHRSSRRTWLWYTVRTRIPRRLVGMLRGGLTRQPRP